MIKVAKQIPIIGSNDLRKEIRSFKLEKDKEPNISINSVWGEVIKDDASYPVFSKLLEAVLSIFHSTATVEGAINTTRNILNLNARKTIKSANKNSLSVCCYDFDVNSENHKRNLDKAHSE